MCILKLKLEPKNSQLDIPNSNSHKIYLTAFNYFISHQFFFAPFNLRVINFLLIDLTI